MQPPARCNAAPNGNCKSYDGRHRHRDRQRHRQNGTLCRPTDFPHWTGHLPLPLPLRLPLSPFPYMFVSVSLPLARHTKCCVNEGNKENNNDKIKDTTAIVVVEREKRKTFAALAHKKNVDDVHHMRGVRGGRTGGSEGVTRLSGWSSVHTLATGDCRIPWARKEAKNGVCLMCEYARYNTL